MSNPSDPRGEEDQPGPAGQGSDIEPHPIVKKILDESGDARDTLLVYGYLGSPDEKNVVRIYLDLGFRAYFEIPKDRILHADQHDVSEATRPTKILIDAGQPLKFVQTLESSFLKGPIASGHPFVTPLNFNLPCLTTFVGCVPSPHDERRPNTGQLHSPPPRMTP